MAQIFSSQYIHESEVKIRQESHTHEIKNWIVQSNKHEYDGLAK